MPLIRELHLVHHSHTDFGYTDLPSTTWDLHEGYIRATVALCEKYRRYPEPARFRWTCEVLWPVQRFLQKASPDLRARFERLVREGLIDLGALPFNFTSLVDAEEWDWLQRDLKPLVDRFAPTVAMQNDISGLPWGMVPRMQDVGVRMLWMGPNSYSTGGYPVDAPAWFWWEGPGGERLLTHFAVSYHTGYGYFHDTEWRRGPVPSSTDVWFNPPQPGDIFAPNAESLKRAHEICQRRLRELPADYPLDILPLSVTNFWRQDNDPPFEGLSDFVAAWNAAGLAPRLRLSTLSEVHAAVASRLPADLPVRRGDWVDWWADYLSPSPGEVAAVQQAKARLVDIPRGATLIGTDPSALEHRLAEAWRNVSVFTEHTFSGFDSVPQPYSNLTLGHMAEKYAPVYRAEELSRAIATRAMRASPAYRPLSGTRRIMVVNPGRTTRSGWVTLSSAAFREPTTAVRDLETGDVLPLEPLPPIQTWGTPEARADLPFEVPNDVWPFRPAHARFRPPPMQAGEMRRYEVVDLPFDQARAAADVDDLVRFSLDPATGFVQDLRVGDESLIDTASTLQLGQVLFDRYDHFGARDDLLSHDAKRVDAHRIRQSPRCVGAARSDSPFAPGWEATFEHERVHRIAQRWHLFPAEHLLEMTTTIWLKEETAAQAIYIAFPLHGASAPVAAYDAMGVPCRVGVDQMPETCGEYHVTRRGVLFGDGRRTLTLATPDTPLGCFDSPAARTGRRSFVPQTAHYFSLVHHNFWSTNVTITKAAELSLRYRLHWRSAGSEDWKDVADRVEMLNDQLWAMPCG